MKMLVTFDCDLGDFFCWGFFLVVVAFMGGIAGTILYLALKDWNEDRKKEKRRKEQQFGVVKKEYRCPIEHEEGQPCPMCRLAIVKK